MVVESPSAVSARIPNDYDIYVMNADGSRQHALLRADGSDYDPDWSPDGRRIAFSGYRDDNSDIYVMNADGTGLTRLTSTREGEENSQLYVMNADGSHLRQLLVDNEYDQRPAWSPDGSKIAFEGGLDEAYVDVVSADGPNESG